MAPAVLPSDFEWGFATAAYQVEALLMRMAEALLSGIPTATSNHHEQMGLTVTLPVTTITDTRRTLIFLSSTAQKHTGFHCHGLTLSPLEDKTTL
jgi:hypothetical protein